jgi:predicted heme/steroid binding protein
MKYNSHNCPFFHYRSNRSVQDERSYWLIPRCPYRETREFTLEVLAQYDGSMGRPAYVAVNGIVYDVSTEATWGGATHFGLIAGKDLTEQFQGCHGMEATLASLPKVGILNA